MSPRERKRRRFPLKVGVWHISSDSYSRERDWLHSAWEKVLQGKSSTETDREKIDLGLKAIALSLIYLDFCYLAYDLDSSHEFVDWAKQLDITALKLIHLGLVDKTEALEIEEDDAIFKDVILRLANDKREDVFDALSPNPYDFELIEELTAIKDPSEISEVSGRVCGWISEKCYQPVEYFD